MDLRATLLGKTANPEATYPLAAGFIIAAFIIAKMVGLEAYTLGVAPFEFRVVASLLPFAMVFRKYGVFGIGVGCPLAHLLTTGNVENAGFAFAAASIGSVSSYFLYKRYQSLPALFGGTLLITLTWTVIFGAYFSLATRIPFPAGFSATLSSLWIAVNLVGFALVALARRVSVSWDSTNVTD